MKSIIIGATKDIEHGVNLLKKHKINFSVLDGNENAEGFKLSKNNIHINIADEDEIIDYVSNNKIDFILPVPIGRYITSWGAINDKFNLKGISRESAVYCTDKWLFHNKLKENNLRDAYAFLVDESTRNKIDYDIEYPAIIKPRFGSGSRGVTQVSNASELKDIVTSLELDDDDYIIEKAIDGTEFGVDAVVFNGEFNIILLREKKLTKLPNRQAVAYFSKFDEIKYPNLLENINTKLSKIVNVLKMDNCLIHVDVMVNEDDNFIIELSARPSGHNLHNNFTIKATEYDMLDEFIKFQSKLAFKSKPDTLNNICIHYFDFENVVIKSIPDILDINNIEGILEYKCNIKKDDKKRSISQGSDLINDGFVIIQGNNRNEILNKVNQVKNLFICEEI